MAEALPKILHVEVSVISHATESPGKVEQALKNILPQELRSSIQISRQYLSGHHGNDIVTMSYRLKDPEATRDFIKNLAQIILPEEKQRLSLEFDLHLDSEGKLFLRLDKQAAYLGEPKFREEDPIRVKVKFGGAASLEVIASELRRTGLIR